MNPAEQAVYDPFIPHKVPHTPSKDITHLKHIVTLLLPYAEREELSTQTSGYTRHVIATAKSALDEL